MKKIISLFAFAVLCASVANAAYVKWAINETETVLPDGYDHAALAMYTDDVANITVLKSYDWAGGATAFDARWDAGQGEDPDFAFEAAYLSGSLKSYADAIFTVIAYDSSNTIIDTMVSTIAGSDLAKYYMDDAVGGVPGFDKGVMSFTVGESIPEPTSAMLVLLGLAGLALKRKQV